ncbi:MAG TPA: S53 family peptidase [Gemmataceae bacterium]|jgi:subtilase family serine protease|nr:S53 family peptidase [Gemmataceae bacterium]
MPRAQLQLERLESRAVPAYLTPAQVRHAYGFDQIQFSANGKTVAGDGSGQIIAIVTAFNVPNIASDLDTFDSTFSINGTQTLLQQYGAASRDLIKVQMRSGEATVGDWARETALDVEWAHAIAPGARILLVEARSDTFGDILDAVDYARKYPGVVAISMSFGGAEFKGETAANYDGHFTTPASHLGGASVRGGALLPGGITFVASVGDTAGQTEWPAVSPSVLSVGGTSLALDSNGNWKQETAWWSGGGGTSPYESKPSYQSGFKTGPQRGTPDVAYQANPNLGFAYYNSVPVDGVIGWQAVGGTSAGAPQWAALVAIADQGRALQGQGSLDGLSQTLPALYELASLSYSSYFHDIITGSNGVPASIGYDLATGLGSPKAASVVKGLASF